MIKVEYLCLKNFEQNDYSKQEGHDGHGVAPLSLPDCVVYLTNKVCNKERNE